MSLDTIMNLSITVESKAPTQAGFGTPLLLGWHNIWLDRRVKEYGDASEMLDDGFQVGDPLYSAALIVKSQNPCPATFKIGRRVTALTQVVTITPLNTTTGFKYTGTVGGKAFTLVVNGSSGASLTALGTAFAAALNTLAVGVTAVANTGVVTCTCSTPGDVVDYDFGSHLTSQIKLKDITTDTTTDAELAAINTEDNDWYGLMVIDSSSTATALHAAQWIESVRKLCVVQSSDSDCLDSNVTTDTMSELMQSSYARTGCIFHRQIGGTEWLAAGWLAGALTTTPGSATMAFKSVAGVKYDRLQTGEESAILAKHGSHYTNTGGIPITFEGKSGSGEFMDTTRFIDWVYARMRERVLGALANNLKIPYTDAGVDVIRGLILSVIQQGITAGGFAADPGPTVSAPFVRDVDPALRINRILPDISWTAQLAGAIHRLNPVRGTVSV